MFIPSSSYRGEMVKLIQDSETVRVAVAFWGKDSDALFGAVPNQKIRIICNLLSGGTNPEPIQKLINKPNIEVRRLETLHAKVVLGGSSAIVGSANISTNGLNHEHEEDPGWIEAGLMTEISEQLQKIGDWFERQWKLASKISKEDLAQAKTLWGIRRNNRINGSIKKSIFDNPVFSLQDRSIFVAMYKEDATQQADETFEKLRSDSVQNFRAAGDVKELSFFDQWDDLPMDSSIICIHVGSRGGTKIEGIYRRLPIFDRPYKIGKKTHRIQVVFPEKRILNFPFGKATRNELRKRITREISDYHKSKTTEGRCITLYEALRDFG